MSVSSSCWRRLLLAVGVRCCVWQQIYVVTLSSPTMTDETLRNLLNSAGVRWVQGACDPAGMLGMLATSQATCRYTAGVHHALVLAGCFMCFGISMKHMRVCGSKGNGHLDG